FMEQTPVFNSINWNFGARWQDNDTVYVNPPNPPDDAAGQGDSMPQMTALVTAIASFLCPSDGMPGTSGGFVVNGQRKLVGSFSYPSNIGLNRRITGGIPDSSWKLNGPNYVAGWDGAVSTPTFLNTFQDGTSNTAIFSEWIKGPATGNPPPKQGLSVVYNFSPALASNAFPTDYQFKQ